jgi:hypothetical protein
LWVHPPSCSMDHRLTLTQRECTGASLMAARLSQSSSQASKDSNAAMPRTTMAKETTQRRSDWMTLLNGSWTKESDRLLLSYIAVANVCPLEFLSIAITQIKIRCECLMYVPCVLPTRAKRSFLDRFQSLSKNQHEFLRTCPKRK